MRLDKAILERGLEASRSRAQELIRSGHVEVNGALTIKASHAVGPDDTLKIVGKTNPWVSRAALKLVHGLEHFGYDPARSVALDVGASTGGFTEVLLANGAAKVFALDVGHGQLHRSLKEDPRVINLEGRNAKDIDANLLPLLDFIVSDVSFISLTKALPKPLGLAREGAKLIALVKPQFEVGRGLVGKGGIVKDANAREKACQDIDAFLRHLGWDVSGITPSPITGSDGNVEFLIGACKSG